jgi:hypothetical protein
MAKTYDYLGLTIKLILLLSIFNGIYNHLWHLTSTGIFLLILMFIPQIVKGYEIKIPSEFEWFLLVFVIATFFLGKMGGIITPIVFGIAVAMIGFMILAILYSSNQIKKNYFLIIMFSFNFAVALGFAIELLKYYLKLLLKQGLSSEIYSYSMQTMTFVIIGAAISSLFGYLYMRDYKGVIRKIIGRFTSKNPDLFSNKESLEKEMLEIIKSNESEILEFKSTLRMNLYTGDIDKKIEYSVLKTLAAFMNTNGGDLFIGVSNKGELLGIENDRFENIDKFLLHLSNIFKEKIGKKFLHLLDFNTIKINNKYLVQIKCKKSTAPVFLKNPLNQEEFYVRIGPSSAELKGSELVEYIQKRFKKKD